jgi:hypothetical protein
MTRFSKACIEDTMKRLRQWNTRRVLWWGTGPPTLWIATVLDYCRALELRVEELEKENE